MVLSKNKFLLAQVFTIALVGALGGCLNASNLDTARALDLGEGRVTAYLGVSAGEDRVVSVALEEPSAPRRVNPPGIPQPPLPPGEPRPTETVHFALPEQGDMSGGFYLRGGVGAGFEIQAGLEMPYVAYGWGGSVGVKWQAPLEGPVSIALSARLAGIASIAEEGRSFTVLSPQARLLTTFSLTDDLHFTIAPTFMNTWFTVEHAETTSASANAMTTGGSVGVSVDAHGVTYHAEVSTLYTPSSQEGIGRDQWVFIPAIGASF
jgi:hypothetical protein